MKSLKLPYLLFISLSLLGFISTPLEAQLISTSSFFQRSAVDQIKISPDGSHLAITVAGDEDSRLIILNLSSRESVASFVTRSNEKIGEFHWVNEERIVFSTLVFQGGLDIPFLTGEIFALNIDNTRKFQLVSRSRDSGAFLIGHLVPDDPGHIRVVRRSIRRSSIARGKPISYLLDVYAKPGGITDNLRSRVTSPLPWGSLFFDNSGSPRVAAATKEDNTIKVSLLYEADWVKIEEFLETNSQALKYFEFVGFQSSDREFYYIGSGEQGIRGLYIYDHQSRSSELIFQHQNFDIEYEDLVFASDYATILGVKLVGDVFEQYYFGDHPETKLHQSLDAAFSGEMVKITSTTRDGTNAVVGVFGPKRWGDFYLLDADSLKLEPIMNRSETLLSELMADVSPFGIRAADGLVIHGYVTQPRETSGPLPMIVVPHGGPIGLRDTPLFNREIQFFAHQGFAVLQVNFRGSGGYGTPFELAGYREWGLKIIDDITQATKWAIQSGIANEDKICIYGGSFGAYAALASAARQPDLYRCAVGYAGVYDLTKLDRSDIPWNPGGETYLQDAVGIDQSKLKAQSPVYNAAKINIPVLLVHGGQDRRAPPFHARDMRKALEQEGQTVEWLYERGEGHGFYNTENKINFYDEILSFFNRNLKQE